jgi:hypothetical protein
MSLYLLFAVLLLSILVYKWKLFFTIVYPFVLIHFFPDIWIKKTLHPQRDSVINYTSLQSESWTTTFDDDTSVDKFLVNLRLLLYSIHIKD